MNRREQARADGERRRQEEEAVWARAARGGYAMVGPSGQTWTVDAATGLPTGPASDDEHRVVRDLTAHERLDIDTPTWLPRADGTSEIVAQIRPGAAVDDVSDEDQIEQARRAVDAVPDSESVDDASQSSDRSAVDGYQDGSVETRGAW